MLSVSDAEAIILQLVQPLDSLIDTEVIDLFTANGRILASPVTSQLDFPHWDNSAMDGYAVRSEDVQDCNEEKPVVLEIIEEIPAGVQPKSIIQSGKAARILTGAVMPVGANTVVMQERTRREGNQVFILATPKPKEFVRQQASYYKAGSQLLPTGIVLNAQEIALLAACQCTKLNVFRRPRVAILSTGDELVTPETPLQSGQIVDSNQYAIAALVQQMGAEAIMLGIVRDEPTALEEAIANALTQADIIISSGGVSVGDYDYVEQILESLGGKIHVRSVAMKPGKPLTVATFPTPHSPLLTPHSLLPTPHSLIYFGLPGNPAAVLVTFWRFVQPAIKKLSGLAEGWEPKFVKARASQELRSDGKRETYVWGQMRLSNGIYDFYPASGVQHSGNLINLAQTNSLAILPLGIARVAIGEEIQVLIQ
ncbi:molybdopterin molybdenumtransferase [Scytonema hofmannii PCC 7110]|uniref:Molybdopterin molybdenumtransferase n=1 Tax=Scytonema hofmannii PCC 7110 TaxID=128403 RepID=A0A139XBT4_9CYAN|nr:gephyrin-like molybdotransferase Glp [Scytonema hofmannii]KYC42167.1 molybdopterin molybdenumtransferase [Scytonema hofmannii PCC 7110]